MIPCHSCVTDWVDQALELAGMELTDLVRRRLIASLLSRPHLILTGPRGIGKAQLVRVLALLSVDGQRERVCWLQGHPWWAVDTANVSRFVDMQTDYSLSRLAQFTDAALNDPSLVGSPAAPAFEIETRGRKKSDPDGRNSLVKCRQAVCVERMSPAEIELYFRTVARWLAHYHGARPKTPIIRLLGTYDSAVPFALDEQTDRLVAQVHLSYAQDLKVQAVKANRLTSRPMLTCA